MYFFISHLLRLALSTPTYNKQHHPSPLTRLHRLDFTFLEDHLDEFPEIRPGEDDSERDEAVVRGAEDILDHDEGEDVGVERGVELGPHHADTEHEYRVRHSELYPTCT